MAPDFLSGSQSVFNRMQEQKRRSQLRFRPTAAMEPIARRAALDQSMGRPSRNPIADMAQVAFSGVPVCMLTAAHTRYKGMPPSRANDHSILITYNLHVDASLGTDHANHATRCTHNESMHSHLKFIFTTLW